MSHQVSPPQDPEGIVRAYLQELDEHDLEGCMRFFQSDAVIEMMNGKHVGRAAIEEWHRQRFEAEFKLEKVQAIRAKGETVVADVVVSTKRLKFYRVNSVAGRATVRVRDGAICEAKLALRGYNPIEGLKHR